MAYQYLILLHEMQSQPVFICYIEKTCAVHLTDSFDVYWSTLFICLMIAVRIVLLDFPSFFEVESIDDVVNILPLSPFYEISPHNLDVCKHKLSCPTKTQQIVVIVIHFSQITKFCKLDPFFKLEKDFVHFRREITKIATIGLLLFYRFCWL